jgi:hypothetical protein
MTLERLKEEHEREYQRLYPEAAAAEAVEAPEPASDELAEAS